MNDRDKLVLPKHIMYDGSRRMTSKEKQARVLGLKKADELTFENRRHYSTQGPEKDERDMTDPRAASGASSKKND